MVKDVWERVLERTDNDSRKLLDSLFPRGKDHESLPLWETLRWIAAGDPDYITESVDPKSGEITIRGPIIFLRMGPDADATAVRSYVKRVKRLHEWVKLRKENV